VVVAHDLSKSGRIRGLSVPPDRVIDTQCHWLASVGRADKLPPCPAPMDLWFDLG
jgi:hypothetical protein